MADILRYAVWYGKCEWGIHNYFQQLCIQASYAFKVAYWSVFIHQIASSQYWHYKGSSRGLGFRGFEPRQRPLVMLGRAFRQNCSCALS